jgi:hypothetical protein
MDRRKKIMGGEKDGGEAGADGADKADPKADPKAEPDAHEEEVHEPAAKPKWIFPAALAVACVALLAGGYLFARYNANDLAILAIGSLVAAGVVAAGFYQAFGLKKDKVKAGITALALVVSLLAATLIGHALQVSEAEQIAQEREQAEAAAAAAKIAREKAAALLAAANAEKTADVAEYQRFENAFIDKADSVFRDYQHTLDVAGWNKILDSDRLRQDKGLAESRTILQQSKAAAVKFRGLHLQLVVDGLKELGALKFRESARLKIMHVFDGGGVYSIEAVGALWDCADKQVAEYEAIFAQLSNKKVNWLAQNGKVLFSEQSDLDVFNGHLAAAQESLKKWEAIREQQKDALDISFDDSKPGEGKPDEAKPGEAKAGEAKSAEVKTDAPKADAAKPDPTKK